MVSIPTLLLTVLSLPSGVYQSNAQEAFLAPPQIITAPGESHHPSSRAFQGIPSLAVSRKGRLWATWYAGTAPTEDHNNYAVLATSGDDGKTWQEVLVVDPDGAGPVRAFDPEVWVDPRGALWFFWTQAVDHDGSVAGVWAMTVEKPDAVPARWPHPRRLTDGVMMCKPVVL